MAVSAVKKEPAKPPAAAPAAPAAAPQAQATKKKGKLLYVALALSVLCGGGGGAWWYLSRDAGPSAPKAEPAKPPVFAPLDAFTVNLTGEDGSQFLQVGLTLRVVDEPAVVALKARMPEIRDRILLLLSAKKANDLLTLEGKRKLSSEIQAAVNAILVPSSAQAATAPAASPATPAPASAAPAAAAPAPAASQEPAGGEQQAQAEPAAEQPGAAQEAAAGESPQAQAAPAPVLPVTGVLFTSFIIQ